MVYEWVGFALLASVCWLQRDAVGADRRAIATLIGGALVLQAQMLRLLAPVNETAQVMSVLDVTTMRLPAVLSLIWALLGAALAYWSGRSGQRSTWTAGTALMAVAAGKLVLLDFGSLGDLGNIFALIAAGGVFMAVAWAVPMPPRAAPVVPSTPPVAPAPHVPATGGAWGETSSGQPHNKEASATPPPAPLEFGTFNLRPRLTDGPDKGAPDKDAPPDGTVLPN